MLKKIVLGVLGVVSLGIVVIVGLAATKPATFRVERTATIAAPPAVIFANLDDFHRYGAWSPWEKLDPQMRKDYSGPERGPGASYAWSGNSDVGRGRMSITESRPNEHLKVLLEFIEPFAATNTTEYDLKPTPVGTEIIWSMHGPNSFAGKVMSVFADMDTMIGKDFEEGLANLKRVSETEAASGAAK
jgi:hypothetical protein